MLRNLYLIEPRSNLKMVKISPWITNYRCFTWPSAPITWPSNVYRHLEAHDTLTSTFLVGFSLKGILRDQEDSRTGEAPTATSGRSVLSSLCSCDPGHHSAFTKKSPFLLASVESPPKLLSVMWGVASHSKWWDTYLLSSRLCRHTFWHKERNTSNSLHSTTQGRWSRRV